MPLLGSCVLVSLGCRLDKNGLVGRKIRSRGNWMWGLRMLLGRVRRTCERATSDELRSSEVGSRESGDWWSVEIARAVVRVNYLMRLEEMRIGDLGRRPSRSASIRPWLNEKVLVILRIIDARFRSGRLGSYHSRIMQNILQLHHHRQR